MATNFVGETYMYLHRDSTLTISIPAIAEASENVLEPSLPSLTIR